MVDLVSHLQLLVQRILDRFGGIGKRKAAELGYEQLPGEAWIEQDVERGLPVIYSNFVGYDDIVVARQYIGPIARP